MKKLVNGKIYTEVGRFCEGVVIRGDKIVACGTNGEIRSFPAPGAKVIDLQGKTVIPGFNDSHLHLYGVARNLNSVVLYGANSIADVIRRCKQFIQEKQPKPSTVIVGEGWNQDYFEDEKRILTKEDLDQISTEYPIVLNRVCYHVAVGNSKALEVAQIDAETPPVPGGEFDLGEDGQPNGIFRETATSLIQKIIPGETPEVMEHWLRQAMDHVLSYGITSVQTNDINEKNAREMFSAYHNVINQGNTPRVYHQCCFDSKESLTKFLAVPLEARGNEYHRVGPLKLFADGSLGARTALLRGDYVDAPGEHGIACLTKDHLQAMVMLANSRQMGSVVHAIGDRAIEMTLDTFEAADSTGQNPMRNGIVHAQITEPGLLNRMKHGNICALVQPIFLHYDQHIVRQRVGDELAETSYAFKTMDRMKIHVSYGTDAPVEGVNPFHGIYCAVTRKDLNGEGGYLPLEAEELYKAIDNYTVGSAYMSYEERVKGRIRPGYFADLAVLDRDIFTVPIEEIKDVQVDDTYVGGELVYRREK